MYLNDLGPLMVRRQDGRLSFDRFRADPALAAVQWPDDVLHDFLFEHGDHGPFVDDYGHLDLSAVIWTLETIPTVDFHTMPTGESEAGLIEHIAQNPAYSLTRLPLFIFAGQRSCFLAKQTVWVESGANSGPRIVVLVSCPCGRSGHSWR